VSGYQLDSLAPGQRGQPQRGRSARPRHPIQRLKTKGGSAAWRIFDAAHTDLESQVPYSAEEIYSGDKNNLDLMGDAGK
jgi:hypothetical protein